ncbi:uncharacterized protein EI90DRAFT_3226658 [Cantharellus anzutake]|uniref:uncharacterized protein n=1 Tax=Cantharellus anzutake TaxID=1750568 RepID=UPI001904EABE|nr:uncharacterized protein EI90DRAFT_3226658 [Cantharellus anzutake]KAF8326997.1 hypothetical protein EI90DRAFT_3226658 [Cantharellus anzutake]
MDTTSSSSPPYSVSKLEARFYYAGLLSSPVLVYRTSTTPWKPPTGPEAYRELKELKPVFNHGIVCDYLDSEQITWTSVDVVRFAKVGETPGPVVLWIGVVPQSLSGEDAHTAAVGCLQLLESSQLTDVEVEFRESILIRSVGPKLLKYVSSTNPTTSVCGLITPALGLPLAARATSYAEGTGALYISQGRDSEKVYILTTRHVVFPPNAGFNELYNRKWTSQPRREVILPGPKAFQTMLKSTMVKIGEHKIMVDYYNQQLQDLQGGGDEEQEEEVIQGKLKEAEATIEALNHFHDKATKYWSEESLRVLGHVAYSPPITVGAGAKRYTEDWALIELDCNKIDWDNFKGNVVDLGTEIPVHNFTSRMYPNPSANTTFKYPSNRLLPLQGIIGEDELRHPQMLDADNEPCLLVIKSGCATGVTTGRATGIMSCVREYFENGPHQTSMEWAILPYDKSGAFSAPGDSGAIIFDGQGRIGGILTGGTGLTETTDVTYATPFYWLFDERIKAHFPNAYLYPVRA